VDSRYLYCKTGSKNICQRTVAIGLVHPGIDFIDFPQFWREGAVKSLVHDSEAPGSAEPTGGASTLA
jgi:hypothetical protein